MFLMILFKILIYELEKNVFFWIYDCFMVFNDFLWLFYDFFMPHFMICLWFFYDWFFSAHVALIKSWKKTKKNH